MGSGLPRQPPGRRRAANTAAAVAIFPSFGALACTHGSWRTAPMAAPPGHAAARGRARRTSPTDLHCRRPVGGLARRPAPRRTPLSGGTTPAAIAQWRLGLLPQGRNSSDGSTRRRPRPLAADALPAPATSASATACGRTRTTAARRIWSGRSCTARRRPHNPPSAEFGVGSPPRDAPQGPPRAAARWVIPSRAKGSGLRLASMGMRPSSMRAAATASTLAGGATS